MTRLHGTASPAGTTPAGARPAAYRILITGSRTWVDEAAIRQALGEYVAQHGPENITTVHGACPNGADAIADEIVRTWTGLTAERHPADWARHGRAAGFIRNQAMVNAGADVCLAFIANNSRGATHCAARAEAAGIPVRRWHAWQ